MYKFVTIYRQVEDPAMVDDFFANTHLQLAERLPTLIKSEVSRVDGKPGGESRFYLMYELYFESRESFEDAIKSKIGLQLIQALKPWGDERLITWFYSDSFTETAQEREAYSS